MNKDNNKEEKHFTTDKEQLLYYILNNMLSIIISQLHTSINLTIDEMDKYNLLIYNRFQGICIISICLVIGLYLSFIIKIIVIKNQIINQLVNSTSI